MPKARNGQRRAQRERDTFERRAERLLAQHPKHTGTVRRAEVHALRTLPAAAYHERSAA